ncbi:hypothetical protein OF830_02295 [Bacillus paramycoides]|uniref:hypothetical protein n=1 Tax=Bacillus paramycoides TaxID=2026194 RepID=UPI0022431FE1|nr:hypothetical protein [Bacillus paramycoides]MCW9129813.1 hypothetical protein [Bacillus paramycoides]
MEENNNNLGKKVAISVMSAALLGTSGYLVYDKGFSTAGRETVKLASNTEEKKDDRITGSNLQSMFPNLVADPTKKDDKPGEKPNINLADLIGNNKSPITPVTYKPDDVSVEKKDPLIKLSDAPTPQKPELPTNMGGPVVEPVGNLPDLGKVNDNKPQPNGQEVDGQKPNSNPDPNQNSNQNPNPNPGPNPNPDPNPNPNPNPGPNPDPNPGPNPNPNPNPGPNPDPNPNPGPNPDPNPNPGPNPNPDPIRPTITVSPKTGDILVEWYTANGEKSSAVFFGEFYKAQNHLKLIDGMTNTMAERDELQLISQSSSTAKANKAALLLAAQDSAQFEKVASSKYEQLFYIRNQLTLYQDPAFNDQEFERFKENKKYVIEKLSKDIFNAALREEERDVNAALSKYYLLTSVLQGVDEDLQKQAYDRVQDIFNQMLEKELKQMVQGKVDVPTVPVLNQGKEQNKNVEEKATTEKEVQQSKGEEKQENKENSKPEESKTNKEDVKQEEAQTNKENAKQEESQNNKEDKKNEEQKDNKDGTKQDEVKTPGQWAIEQVTVYMNEAKWKEAIVLADQYIDQTKGEEQNTLQDQLKNAVENLLTQSKAEETSAEMALQNYHFILNIKNVVAVQKEQAKSLSLPVMLEVKADKVFAEKNYYDAVLYMANSIRNGNKHARAFEKLQTNTNFLWNQTMEQWNNLKGNSGWQSEVKKSVQPSLELIVYLKDISPAIVDDTRFNEKIKEATKKLEGIQLLNLASYENSKSDEASQLNALYYYGQAYERGIADAGDLSNIFNKLLNKARGFEVSDPARAMNLYRLMYTTPGAQGLGFQDVIRNSIDYLNDFNVASQSFAKYGNSSNVKDIATALAYANTAIENGYANEQSKAKIRQIAETMVNVGQNALKGNDLNTAYQYFEFVSRADYKHVPQDVRSQANDGLQAIKNATKK